MPAKRGGTAVKKEDVGEDEAKPADVVPTNSPPSEQTPIGTPQRAIDESPAVTGGKRKVCVMHDSPVSRAVAAS